MNVVPVAEPRWWYDPELAGSSAPRLLAPVSWVWGQVAAARLRGAPDFRSRYPVVCVGNFTAGGTGKTPLTIALGNGLRELGYEPLALTRGYGARKGPPRWVDASGATADDVGDEALLLARTMPVVVSADRAAGAAFIEAERPAAPRTVILMDDGLQNPTLAKDVAIAVVDGRRGIGNGRVIPAGPLRARMADQWPLVDAVVVNGGARDWTVADLARPPADGNPLNFLDRAQVPVVRATMLPSSDTAWLRERPVFAYCGIGNPARFYDLLQELGAEALETRTFSDHHPFTEREAAELIELAGRTGATLVTTEKDWVRLSGLGGVRGDLKAKSRPLPVALAFDVKGQKTLLDVVCAGIEERTQKA
ncbi:MAG: tetraacyldisaccharide 4'-kinase [Hyphomicrobium sp.]|nr:tetraacyldisaccharide 4'-kinase [Hyphomicrobium sp.]